jgi:excisionase family DNA binding protein
VVRRGPASPEPHSEPDLRASEPPHRPARARFLQLSDVCTILDISASQTYALVRSGELPAIKIGGRGQWRVEFSQLEQFIARMYDETRTFVATHPFGSADDWGDDEAAAGSSGEARSDELSVSSISPVSQDEMAERA